MDQQESDTIQVANRTVQPSDFKQLSPTVTTVTILECRLCNWQTSTVLGTIFQYSHIKRLSVVGCKLADDQLEPLFWSKHIKELVLGTLLTNQDKNRLTMKALPWLRRMSTLTSITIRNI